MKQIDKIAREIKREFCGRYNDYYKSLTIFLDTENDELYVKYWGQGEHWIEAPKNLLPLTSYSAQYGNWGDWYGNDNNWSLTKKAIAYDIKEAIGYNTKDGDKSYDIEDDYYGIVNIPEWLTEEIDFYTKSREAYTPC